jgi:hypothetical protein
MTFNIVGKFVDLAGFAAHVDGLVFTGWTPQFVVVHNTSAPSLANYADWRSHPERHGNWTPEKWLQNLMNYYANEQHWNAGPHAFVCPDGVGLFTPFTQRGVHSPAWNAITWGIETVGEFETEAFDNGSKTNLIAVLGILHARIGLNPGDYKFGVRGIHFHKEDPITTHKSCPGKNMVKADLIDGVVAYMQAAHPGDHAEIPMEAHTASATETASPAPADDAVRHSMAKHILDFEARRDKNGHLAVYDLPPNDGGGRWEIAGINEKYDEPELMKLKQMLDAGQFDAAETEAESYYLQNTAAAMSWTTNAGVEFYLRDCIFNRGAKGAARILQRACGVHDDGDVGDQTRLAMSAMAPADMLVKLRAARESYEREVVGYRANLWNGLVNRWNNALTVAKSYL